MWKHITWATTLDVIFQVRMSRQCRVEHVVCALQCGSRWSACCDSEAGKQKWCWVYNVLNVHADVTNVHADVTNVSNNSGVMNGIPLKLTRRPWCVIHGIQIAQRSGYTMLHTTQWSQVCALRHYTRRISHERLAPSSESFLEYYYNITSPCPQDLIMLMLLTTFRLRY
jgi:hypothetical protein